MDTKHCKRCNKIKSVLDFAKNSQKKDGLQTYCKACVKVINHDYYLRTPEKNPDRIATKDRLSKAAREYVWTYLCGTACVDCGNSDPVVLEFDHVRGIKKYDISSLIRRGYSVATVQSEIDKCEVRCANCHRKVTYEREGSWRTLMMIR